MRGSDGSVRGSQCLFHSDRRLANVALLPDCVSAPVLFVTGHQQLASADRRLPIPCRRHRLGSLSICVCNRPISLLPVCCCYPATAEESTRGILGQTSTPGDYRIRHISNRSFLPFLKETGNSEPTGHDSACLAAQSSG